MFMSLSVLGKYWTILFYKSTTDTTSDSRWEDNSQSEIPLAKKY